MEIKRDKYLKSLVEYQWNGQIKVISGIRRCGKSYLLRKIFNDYLLKKGILKNHIISLELDQTKNIKYRNPIELSAFIRKKVENKKTKFYLFIDEIQLSDEVINPYNLDGKKITFYDTLNELRELTNLDIYVTGSNSKMLSTDILTEFRGRSDNIKLHPLSFSEYYTFVGGDKEAAFDDYSFYGGMPFILSRPNETAKMEYLKDLFKEVYLKDIVERKKINRPEILSSVVDFLCSSIGSLTNPTSVTNSLNSKQKLKGKELVSINTVNSYMRNLEDAFLFNECKRFDVRGKSYFDFPNKYYCEDVGLRNARIGFRQQELTHIMENIIYNELIYRGFHVDVGVVYESIRNLKGNPIRIAKEIDFVATLGDKKFYLQSAFAMESEEKRNSELKPFLLTKDSFPKIIIRKDIRKRWIDENGILNIGLIDFLLDYDLMK